MREEAPEVGRSPAARTVCVCSNAGIYWAMSALVAGSPQTYREVLAFLTSHLRTEVRITVPRVIHGGN
jgi:hypothetical protein